jgi:MoaA/NifB/PqqE/SkfB family radical SAM enzyme
MGEGKALIDQVAELQAPLFVFTGGDPIKRPDLFELVRHAVGRGIRTALTPSATPLLTRDAIVRLKEMGLARLAVSVDASRAGIHDAVRGVAGTYERTLDAVRWANEAELPIQVHTTVSRHNAQDLDDLAQWLSDLKIVMWSVFFLVPLGRGKIGDLPTAEEFERIFARLFELSKRVPFQIKTTEATHYRRYLTQHNTEGRAHGAAPIDPASGGAKVIGWATRRVNDRRGFVFVSHTGYVYPSGFLPVKGGNVRQQSLGRIYRESRVFCQLRDLTLLNLRRLTRQRLRSHGGLSGRRTALRLSAARIPASAKRGSTARYRLVAGTRPDIEG